MNHIQIVVLLMTLTACGPQTPSFVQTLPSRSELAIAAERVEHLAITCDDLVTANRPHGLTQRPECDTGDSMLFSALSLFGKDNQERVFAMKSSFGEDGRPFRSPEDLRAGGGDKSFSRDMTMGVLVYLALSRDVDLARRFWAYIFTHSYNVCPMKNGSCLLTPAMLAVFRDVWRHIGLEPPKETAFVRWVDEETLFQTVASVDPGYQLHLVSVNVFIRLLTGNLTQRYRTVMDRIVAKQPENPWYRYLQWKLQQRPTHELAPLADLTRIQLSMWPRGIQTDWSFEKGDLDEGFRDSMGHEWILLANLLIKEGY